ncbi:MAG: hypothetical protein CFE26_08425 [Verrucomicrobiales bacterium VVV1]|nr:MAG: hypothetical protein CFE26_08425 [Verrucomicrobiales bacterium VVV1]
MKLLFPLLAFATILPSGAAPIHSGHASAELIASSSTFEASKPVNAAIRLTVDSGWHTYWTNPGEGGMKLGAEWVLPEGWSAGPLGWPVPIRFKTGDLPGFGYVGEVIIPVTLTPPPGAPKAARIAVKLDWLTCDESACIPGDAAPTLELSPGPSADTPSAPIIQKAMSQVPAPLEGLALSVAEEGKALILTLTAPAGADPATMAAFPATPQVVDPAATFKFLKSGASWTARVSRSEYLEGSPKSLELVISGGGLPHPATVVWSKK